MIHDFHKGKPQGFNPDHVYVSCSVNTRLWYLGCNGNSRVFTSMTIQKIGEEGRRMMHQRSFPSIIFWPLLSIFSFCVPTHWVSVLGRRSSISHDNKHILHNLCKVFEIMYKQYLKLNIDFSTHLCGKFKWKNTVKFGF